jgi:hypothetical protein
MSESPQKTPHPPQFTEPQFRVAADGRVFYTPDKFWPKLAFLLGSLLILAFGLGLAWDPLTTLLFGEKATARVVRIVRSDPGEEDRVIRFRQPIEAGGPGTSFAYFVAVETPAGERRELRLGVGSRGSPYEVAAGTAANINEEFEVIYRPGEDIAYGLYHHRTWAFGAGFVFVGGLLTICAIPTLRAVGREIEVDP